MGLPAAPGAATARGVGDGPKHRLRLRGVGRGQVGMEGKRGREGRGAKYGGGREAALSVASVWGEGAPEAGC